MILLVQLVMVSAKDSKVLWKVKDAPNTKREHCGYKMASHDKLSSREVYHASTEHGTYNHAVMMDWHENNMLLTWKNSPKDEDSPGQRVLYSQSADGANWTATDGKNVMFPSVSTDKNPAALFAAPTVILNGTRYASASPKQFCLWPPPIESPVVMRKVSSEIPAKLGPMFWLAESIPAGFEDASTREGIQALPAMDGDTQHDMALLSKTGTLPCDTAETSKCEACREECDYPLRPPPKLDILRSDHEVVSVLHGDLGGGGEYTRYTVPNSTEEIILHRTKSHKFAFTHRTAVGQPWSNQSETEIPDARSNLNAGSLPDGRIFLVSNPCPSGKRDPLVVSTSASGLNFDKAVGVMTCKDLNKQCKPRHKGRAKNPGQAYPQAVAATAPDGMKYLWVAATNNKEDVWVTRVSYDAL